VSFVADSQADTSSNPLSDDEAAALQDELPPTTQPGLAGLNPLSRETRVLERFYYTGAVEAQPDKQGRVMLPPALIEHGRLGREVVVVGMRDRLEIWDRAAWRAQLKEVMGSAEDVAERLAAQHD